MRVVIEQQLVVNFVGENYQIVLSRQLCDLLQHAASTNRTGRIIGIDKDNSARLRSDLPFQITKVGLPAIVLVQLVGVEFISQLAQNSRIKRIVRERRENII